MLEWAQQLAVLAMMAALQLAVMTEADRTKVLAKPGLSVGNGQ